MRQTSRKVLIIADAYPTAKNISMGNFVKYQREALQINYPHWEFDVYYNPFFKIFSNPLKKQSLFWNILKWGMQLVCFSPYLLKKYDLVHAHRFFLPVINGAIYKFFHKKPLVVTSHGILQIKKRRSKKWVKNLFYYCDYILTVNHEMRQQFLLNFDLDPDSISVRSCGIDFFAFDKLNHHKKTLTDNDDIITFGFVGDFSENKRPYLFVQCIEALHENFPVHGIMIGGGKNFRSVRDYISNRNLPIKVYGTLPHDELIGYYQKFDLLVFPSASETFGIVGIEALYCYVPVISSKVGGKKDYIKDQCNGILFEKDNIDDLIHKTEELISDKNKLHLMQSRARESIKNYSNDKVAEDIVNIYQKVLQEND